MPSNDPFRDPEANALRLATAALTLTTAAGLIAHEWRALVGDNISVTQDVTWAAGLIILLAALRTSR